MYNVLMQNDIVAFCEANVSPHFIPGAINIAQANGIAGLHSNTVMFGWPKRIERLVSQLKIMRTISKIGKNTIIARLASLDRERPKKRIDLWWGGLEYNGDLMLLLTYLLQLNPGWTNARTVVHSIVYSEEEKDSMKQSLRDLIQSVRIEADTEVIVESPDTSVSEIVKAHSSTANIIFFGLMIPEEGDELEYAERLMNLSEGLRSVVFVRNASEFSGRLI
jgi:hypothetical protein